MGKSSLFGKVRSGLVTSSRKVCPNPESSSRNLAEGRYAGFHFRYRDLLQTRLIPFICCLLSFFMITACDAAPTAIDSRGRAINLQDYKGKWVLVNYWAEWCHACLMEMPDLVKLQAKYHDKIALIGVNFDEKSDDYLNRFIADHHLNYSMTSHLDPSQLGFSGPMATVPTTVLIAPNGKISQVILQPKVLSQWVSLMGLTTTQH